VTTYRKKANTGISACDKKNITRGDILNVTQEEEKLEEGYPEKTKRVRQRQGGDEVRKGAGKLSVIKSTFKMRYKIAKLTSANGGRGGGKKGKKGTFFFEGANINIKFFHSLPVREKEIFGGSVINFGHV